MPATPFDSALHAGLWGDAELGALFTDGAELAAMLRVWAALARAEARARLIPAQAGAALARALEALAPPDPARLAPETGRNGVVVPALLAELRAALPAELGDWLHLGATSQDIQDSGLMLRLGAALEVLGDRLDTLLIGLATQAETHAERAMAARTYGQIATPTTFGALVALWGRPFLDLAAELDRLRPRVLAVSLGGAAGTLAAMGGAGPAVRAALAEELGLADPGAAWHAERGRIADLAHWLARVALAAGKMGEDIFLLAQSGIEEVVLPGGSSSSMPQKVNPVVPAALAALARHAQALAGVLAAAALHRQNRDGAAWFGEWLALPQLVIAAGRALALAGTLAAHLRPDPARMQAALGGAGLVHAEALARALAQRMPRAEAQAAVAALVAEARATGASLLALAAARWPDLALARALTAEAATGTAPAEARAFAAAVRARGS